MMIRATEKLRFVRRVNGKDVSRILQQQWVDEDPPDEGAIRYQWRDVPTADETT